MCTSGDGSGEGIGDHEDAGDRRDGGEELDHLLVIGEEAPYDPPPREQAAGGPVSLCVGAKAASAHRPCAPACVIMLQVC